MIKLLPILLLSLSVLADGCANGNCRQNRQKEKDASGFTPSAQNQPPAATMGLKHVRVFKYDGSRQCGQESAVPLPEMQKEFGSMQVFKAENKPDKLMHTMVCGSPTGKANVYEILDSDLPIAKKLGFKEWLWD